MVDCKMMINDITVKKNKIKFDAVLVYPSSVTLQPKVRIIFTRGNEIRRLPFLVKGTFNRSRTDDICAICSYTYLIDSVFLDNSSNADISVGFEVSFGDDCDENVAFVISEGIRSQNAALKIDDKYVGGSTFDGATIFRSDFNQEDEDDLPQKSYFYVPDPANRCIIIKVKENLIKSGGAFAVASAICKNLSFVVNMLICILLLPYFIIDGIFAGLELIPQHKYAAVEGRKNIIIGQIKTNIASYLKAVFKGQDIALKLIRVRDGHYNRYYKKLCKKPVVENRIAFISGRRDELGGNEKFVYDLIKDNKDIDFQFLMSSELDRFSKSKSKKRFYELYATSKVVIVDDYYNLLNTVEKRKDVTLFQLWHACGAFKTFGFSRLGKTGSPKQTSPNHRMYDYTIVSSEEIRKYYAEGFGISDEKVLATGIPRTDIFADEEYAKNIKENFYAKYPQLKDKKIVFFAPTFRGIGQKSAYYPTTVFDPNEFYEKIGDEYAILIKFHPFCSERFTIKEKYKDYIIDLSDEDELNDLLFVTDLLITDYSSSVFEASLLNIPMLFYPYDLYQYISERDFYCDFESFVPGKIAFTFDELTDAVNKGDFEEYKIEPFKHKFFTELDGKSSQRVADAVIKALKE